jgi:hypothetical protein
MHDSWPVSHSTRFLVVGIALYLHSPFTVGLTVCLTGQEGQPLRSGSTRSAELLRDHRPAGGLHDVLPDVPQSARGGDKVPIRVVSATARSTTRPSPLDQAIRAAITHTGVGGRRRASARLRVFKKRGRGTENGFRGPAFQAAHGLAVLQGCARQGRAARLHRRWASGGAPAMASGVLPRSILRS